MKYNLYSNGGIYNNMCNEKYKNKFSFGIDLDIDIEDYKKIIEKYSEYLSSVYFSLPNGRAFHTREKMREEYDKEDAKEKLLEILNLFKNSNIKLEAIINQYNIQNKDLYNALDWLDNFIQIDSICCLDEYLDIITEHYFNNVYLVSSYNNNLIHNENINKINNKYNMIVVGREFLREPKLLKKIKQRGFDVKLLINNGCSFNCKTCRNGTKNCIKIFNKNLEKFSPNELYAIQSYFPWELNNLMKLIGEENIIDEIKISTRPSTYEYLDKCLSNYIFIEDEKEYIKKDYMNYHLYGRQANLIPYFNKLNLDEIEKIKKELWYDAM